MLSKGLWFAEWNKDFNSYLAQNISYSKDGKKKAEKQSLHSFILGVNTKAPIRHINGDTLDNRKANLDIFNQNTINDYVKVDSESVEVILRDKYGNEKARAIIDREDLNKVVNDDHGWVYHKSNNEVHAVANTPKGRIYLDRFLTDYPENMIVHHINLNPLDNRRANLELIHDEEKNSFKVTQEEKTLI